jgi:uncharacterized membrane protein
MTRALVFFAMYVSGYVCGEAFNRFTKRVEATSKDAASASARTYSYDLYGAASGSLLCGGVLIPLLGFGGCAIGMLGAGIAIAFITRIIEGIRRRRLSA